MNDVINYTSIYIYTLNCYKKLLQILFVIDLCNKFYVLDEYIYIYIYILKEIDFDLLFN